MIKGSAERFLGSIIETHLEKAVISESPLCYYVTTLGKRSWFLKQQATVGWSAILQLINIWARGEVPAAAVAFRDTPRLCPFCDVCYAVTIRCDIIILYNIIVGSTHSNNVIVVAAGQCHHKGICPVILDLQTKICLQNPYSTWKGNADLLRIQKHGKV